MKNKRKLIFLSIIFLTLNVIDMHASALQKELTNNHFTQEFINETIAPQLIPLMLETIDNRKELTTCSDNTAEIDINDTQLIETFLKSTKFFAQSLNDYDLSNTQFATPKTTLLMRTAEVGHAQLADLLLTAGVDIDKQNIQGETALHIAVAYGHVPIVKLLIKRDANLNMQTKYGKNTPLHLALNRTISECNRENKERCGEIAHLLLDAGANSSIKNNDYGYALSHYTPLELAVAYSGYDSENTKITRSSVVKRLLNIHEASINYTMLLKLASINKAPNDVTQLILDAWNDMKGSN